MFEERLRVAGVVLRHLQRGPRRYTELLRLTLGNAATPGTFRSIMGWLLKGGYVERPERGLYTITGKGCSFLETIMEDEKIGGKRSRKAFGSR